MTLAGSPSDVEEASSASVGVPDLLHPEELARDLRPETDKGKARR